MPKKKDNTPATDKISWIKNLPEQGGAWGKSILQTVEPLQSEIDDLEKQKAEIDEKLKARKKIVDDAVKRADKEVHGLFNEKQIQQAKAKATGNTANPSQPAKEPPSPS